MLKKTEYHCQNNSRICNTIHRYKTHFIVYLFKKYKLHYFWNETLQKCTNSKSATLIRGIDGASLEILSFPITYPFQAGGGSLPAGRGMVILVNQQVHRNKC